MVGFFSSTKLFLVNRLMWRMRKGGRRVILYRRRTPLDSCVVKPLYLARTVEMGTWGMMFFSTASWKRGGAGRSMARKRKGEWVDLTSAFDHDQRQSFTQPR